MSNEEKWLRKCFETWTTSTVQTSAWSYRNDFEGFCKWFLEGEI